MIMNAAVPAWVSMAVAMADDDKDVGTVPGSSNSYTPSISIDCGFFPWMDSLRHAVGGFQAFALVVLVFALIGCAIVWTIGHFFDLGHHGTQAKIGLVVTMIAAIVVGCAAQVVGFFAGLSA